MRLFAIGDLHLSGGDDKPMDVFGSQWDRHFFRISEAWRKTVDDRDTVLIPGDISWAMQLEQAVPDLQAIGDLPGRKILCKGNHDYWWNSVTRSEAFCRREWLRCSMMLLSWRTVWSAEPGDG